MTSGVALLAGATAALGWAPYGWWPVALACYAVLFHLLSRADRVGDAIAVGAAFGLGLHAVGNGWMYATLSGKIGLGPVAAAFSALLWLFYLSLFTALPCALFKALTGARRIDARAGSRRRAVFVFAAILTLGEWARSLCFNGFTSLSLGYAVVDTWLGAFAPVGGMYLCGFLCYAVAGSAACAASAPRTSVGAVVGVAMLCALGAGLARIGWAEPAGAALGYRLVQANLAPEDALDPFHAKRRVRHLVDRIVEAPADIVLTPETAFPMFANELPADVLARLQRFSQESGSHVFLGVAAVAANSDGFNSVLQISPRQGDGAVPFARYDKVRLMPFGEYGPIGFGWFTRSINVPRKNMSAGDPRQPPFNLVKAATAQSIGVLVCHEDMVGRDAARWAPNVSLLLNPSNLAWFERSLLVEQQLQVVQMRAREIARPILRAANPGVTAHVDARGRVVARLPTSLEGTLAGSLQPMRGATPYARTGDGPVVALCCLALLAAALRRRSQRRPRVVGREAETQRRREDEPDGPRPSGRRLTSRTRPAGTGCAPHRRR